MDKWRALEYAIAAADGGSFSVAARRLDVTLAAVSKQVAALERELGFRLFERRAGGLALTGLGASYLEASRDGLARLGEAEEQARSAAHGLQGTVVVGVQPSVAQEVLCEALPQFHALHPDLRIDLRYFVHPAPEQIDGVDAMLAVGWSQAMDDLVTRRLGAVGLVVCASPGYWSRHPKPEHPADLAQHQVLALRSRSGTLMDLWRFRRGAEQVEVPIRGWLMADNGHRDTLLRLASAGHGIVRLLDWSQRPGCELAQGRLQAALTDWEPLDVPAVTLHYPPSARRVPRVRAFIDFATRLFEGLERQRADGLAATERPAWLAARRARASRPA